ncbi:hypothetical protein K1W54_08545 [Micromonospora sp. CPCC 205371]|nr:hypothetical protein [Micromonospora sp. CPCC 205371]
MASTSEPAHRPFPWRVRQQLCHHLLELPEMPTPARRDHMIRQVTQDFPGLHSVARQNPPHADLLEFVTAAHDYPGALRRLLEILSYLYAPDDRLTPISQLIGAIEPEDLLTRAERQSVIDRLASVEATVVAGAFHYSTRITVVEAGVDLSDVTAIVALAEAFPGSAGRLPPFFDFVDYIAHRCPRSTRASLHDWMDQVSHRLGYANRSAVDAICRTTENRLVLSGRYFLVTEVCPDRGAPDRFFLAAWRQHEDEPEEMLYQADSSMPWEQAIDTIHRLMRELAWVVEHTARERILELAMPRGLVTHSIDQWQVDPALPSPIGTIYPLVLRSFDRLEDRSMHGEWERNWAWLKEHGRTAGLDAIREVGSHDPVAAQALRSALLREGPPAAVLMLRALPASDDLGPDAYTAGLRGGAPIMIWSRDDATAAELADWIRGICHEDLLELPLRVFQLRLRALDDTDATPVGGHIALVYDDHDRIPEKFRSRSRLRPPQQRKRASL